MTRYDVLAAVGLQLLVLALQRVLQFVPVLEPAGAAPLRGAVLGVVLLSVVAAFSLWKAVGFQRPLRVWHVVLGLAPVAGAVLVAAMSASGSWSFAPHADGLVRYALVGFNEELVGRGLILVLLARRPPPQAVLWSALIFASAHLATTDHVVDQFPRAVSAFADGALFAALWLRGANLGVLMLGHGLTDIVLADTQIQPDLLRLVLVSLAQSVIFVVVALRLTPAIDRSTAQPPSATAAITGAIAVIGLLPELAFGLFLVVLSGRALSAPGADFDRTAALLLWPPAVLLVLIVFGAALGISRKQRAIAIVAVLLAELLAIASPGGGQWSSLAWSLVLLPHLIWLARDRSAPASADQASRPGLGRSTS